MPIDPSIALRGRPIQLMNPMDMAYKAQNMKQMIMQNQALEQSAKEKAALNDAFKKSTITDENGNTSLDQKALMNEVNRTMPQKGLELAEQFRNHDINKLSQDTKVMQNLMSGATPDNWQQIKQKALSLGITNAEKLPDQVDAGMIKGIQMRTLDVQKQIDYANREKDFQLRKQELSEKRLERIDARREKQQNIVNKQNQSIKEVQDRYLNIKDGLRSLNSLIEKHGTQELFGAHDKKIEQFVTTIATDMAKLTDPNSVARPSEVESFKSMLFEPTLWMQDSTAEDALSNFEKIVDERLKTAYKVRGLENVREITDKTRVAQESSPALPREGDTQEHEGVNYVVKGGYWVPANNVFPPTNNTNKNMVGR